MKIEAKHKIDQVLRAQDNLIEKIEDKAEQFLDAAARIGANNSKDKRRADTWVDRSGNLRASIHHFLRQVGSKKEAVVSAGMEYAAFVHFRDGYKVLEFPSENQIKSITDKLKV